MQVSIDAKYTRQRSTVDQGGLSRRNVFWGQCQHHQAFQTRYHCFPLARFAKHNFDILARSSHGYNRLLDFAVIHEGVLDVSEQLPGTDVM